MNAKYLWFALFVLLASGPARSQRGVHPLPPLTGMPALNVAMTATLSPPYSCNGSYAGSGLYVTQDTQADPELLLNGACGSQDYFDVNLSGDDMSLIADLGPNLPLASVTTQRVFNLKNVFTFADFTQFSSVAPVVQGHTYAALINTDYRRALIVFTVTSFVPDQQAALEYEVKDYQINSGIHSSPGFSWNK